MPQPAKGSVFTLVIPDRGLTTRRVPTAQVLIVEDHRGGHAVVSLPARIAVLMTLTEGTVNPPADMVLRPPGSIRVAIHEIKRVAVGNEAAGH